MDQLKSVGKIFYGLGIAGIGLLQFIYPGFRPVMLPIPPETTAHLNILVYLTGAVLVFTGVFIAFWKKCKSGRAFSRHILNAVLYFGTSAEQTCK